MDATVFYTKIDDYICEYTSKTLIDPNNPDFRYRTFTNQDATLYASHDLCIDYIFDKLSGLRNVNVYLDIINLTDKAYKEHTVQYEGVAIGFEEAHLQPGIDIRTDISFEF